MNFINRSRARGGGGGALPLAGICHPLTEDPLFCIFFSLLLNASLFYTLFTPNDPHLLLFLSKFSSEIKNVLKLPGFCAISCQMTPLFWICHLMSQMTHPLFARKLSLMVPRFDASVWAPLSLLYVSAPPRGRDGVPKQHGSFKFGYKYYNKGAWPQIIIESIFSDII